MSSLGTVRVLPAIVGLVVWLAPHAGFGAAGDLDPSFGAGGIVVTTITSQEDRANAGVILPDGRIIAVGGRFTSSNAEDFALVRYQPTGIPDPSFGSGGLVATTVGQFGELTSVVLQPDAKIVAVGYVQDAGVKSMALVRYDAVGVLDPSFGSGGVVSSTLGPGPGVVRSLLLQPDGKLVVAGEWQNADPPTNQAFALARFNDDGSVDTTFGTSGEVITDVNPGFDIGQGAALQPDGRILVSGTALFHPTVVRYESDGSLDGSFGVGGVATSPASGFGGDVAVQPDGKIVVVGQSFAPGGSDGLVVRWDTSGVLDAGFGTGGEAVTPIGPEDDYFLGVAVQPDGRIVAVGQIDMAFFTSSFGVVRYLDDGTLDPGFGTGGIVTTPFGPFQFSTPMDVLLQPDGRIVAIGQKSNLGPRDFTHVRYFGNVCGDGALQAGEACDDGNTSPGDCCSPTCTFEAAGTICGSDGNACTHDLCDATGTCEHPAVTCALCEVCDVALGCYEAPRAGCLGTAPAGKSSLQVRDKSPDTRDLLRWKWRSGTVAIGDFGNPVANDDYALCIYQGPSSALWRRHLAPAGGTCGSGRPCWKTLAPVGAKYTDRELTPHGLASLVLRSNVPGQVQLKLKGKGVQLGLPLLGSLALPVRVQLQREGGVCWDATYATAKTSTSLVFDARNE